MKRQGGEGGRKCKEQRKGHKREGGREKEEEGGVLAHAGKSSSLVKQMSLCHSSPLLNSQEAQ